LNDQGGRTTMSALAVTDLPNSNWRRERGVALLGAKVTTYAGGPGGPAII